MKTKITFIFILTLNSFLFSQNSEKNLASYFEASENRIVKYKNIIKVDYLRAALNGNTVFTYERYLTPLVSMELEAGLTYYNLFGMMVGNITEEKSYFDSGYKFGYSAGAGIRLYPKKDEMEGFYINPSYRFLNYNHIGDSNSASKVKRNLHDARFVIGYQQHLGRVSAEYFLGSGVRFSQLSYNTQNSNALEKVKINNVLPLILVGFKIGYFF